MNPVDLIGAHPWRSATFTTYALSLAFFESIVLDALVRGGSRSALILSDLEGVRASLSEKGVRRAGREYEVEPVSVAHGVFHPKITVLHSDDDCHLLVGSGNLTFGGWGGNLEVLEHLHPSFAADAFHDVADFFEGMATSAELRHGVSDRCLEVARQLRSSVATYPRNGDIRVLHSIGSSIADQIVKLAADLGGATRLLVVSPFWDSGEAVDRLAGRLELDEVFVHSHPGGCVEGRAGSNWPREKLRRAVPVRLAVFGEDNPRRLHGKVFEVSCKRGRLLVSGSANATAAALEGRGNVEASVVRIQHDGAAWEFAAAQPPLPNLGDEDGEEEVSVKAGVLRAVLDSDQLVGEVFAPRLSGEAFALRVSTVGSVSLGRVVIGKDYRFVMSAPGLEVESWKGARIVLRLEWSTGESAEGYVSVAAFTEIQRRAGVMVSRLLALLSGTETPADVAAIFSWFHENPDRLRRSFGEAKGSRADDDSTTTGGDATVAVDELNIAHAVGLRLDGSAATASGSGWARFIDQLLSSLRERGGPASGASIDSSEDDDDDDDADDSKSEERARSDRENTKAFV